VIRIIANPAAGRGRARRSIPSAHAAFSALGGVELRETACAGDEARLVREALDDGCRVIVALGGDGTWSKVAAAIVAARADCALALLAGGTGNDLAKNLGVPARDPVATARLVAQGAERRIDVGLADDRVFVNCAGFGFDAAVLRAAEGRTWPRGDALYVSCALEQILSYRGVEIASGADAFRTYLLLVIANGARFGGSFRIAPGADVSDGALDIVGILDAAPLRRMRLFAAAVRGTHVALPEVGTRRMSEVRLRFREAPLFQVDGDLYRASGRNVAVRCMPGALRIVSAASASPDATSESAR
jgi:diacylglycerol kinase (ATP)